MPSNTVNTFSVRQYLAHGYRFTEIHVRECRFRSVEEQIESCVDNKAGYQSVEIAQQQETKFRRILAAGHESTYDAESYGLEITLSYQHYIGSSGTPDGYCDPRYDTLGRNFRSVEQSVKFLRKIGTTVEKRRCSENGSDFRKVSSHSFESPERVIAALRKLKAVEVSFDRDLDDCVRVLTPSTASEAA